MVRASQQFLAPCGPASAVAKQMGFSWSRLSGLQLLRHFRDFVVAVQWIASGRQSIPRRCRTIAERPANPFMLNDVSFAGIPQKFRIGQNHAAHTNSVGPSFAYR